MFQQQSDNQPVIDDTQQGGTFVDLARPPIVVSGTGAAGGGIVSPGLERASRSSTIKTKILLTSIAVCILAAVAILILTMSGWTSDEASIDSRQVVSGLAKAKVITINGELQLHQGFVLNPQSQPANLAVGSFYLDKSDGGVYYYANNQFNLLATSEEVASQIDQKLSSFHPIGTVATNSSEFATLNQSGSNYQVAGNYVVGDSSDYIQNTTSPQAANFNIAGNGVIGTDLAVSGNSSVTGSISVAGGIVSTWVPSTPTTYKVASSPYSLTPFNGTSILLGDDGMSNAINLPFSFKFYGQTYHSIYICDNGYITFMSGQTCYYGAQSIPSIYGPHAAIYGVQRDLNDNLGGTISYGTVGTAPNRTFIVYFNGVYRYGGDASSAVTFQIKLHETSWNVEIDTAATGGSTIATQGIENTDGSEAKYLAGRNQTSFSLTNDSVIFTSVFLSAPLLTVDAATGNIGVGTDSPTYRLQVAGDVGIKGDTTIQGGINVGGGSLSYVNLPFDREDYSTGTWPEEAIATDINNDGCSDLISGNYVTDNVSVMPGDCSGNFSTFYQYAIGSGARGTRFADFNKDGYQDIVTFNQSDSTVSVLINKGASGKPGDRFFPHVDYPAGSGPVYGTTADINGDGYPDIVVPNSSNSSFSVLINKGDGTFDAPVSYGSSSYTSWSARTGDLNGDGYPDVILTPYNSGGPIRVYINKGATGTPGDRFEPPFDLQNYGTAQFTYVYDFNGDGKNDIAATIGYYVYIYLNNGDGTFSSATSVYDGIYGKELAVADMNDDGIADLVVDSDTDNAISILLGKGSDQSYYDPKIIDALTAKSIYVTDLNNDTMPDIVTANQQNSSVSVFINGTSQYSSAHGIYKSVASISTPDETEAGLIIQGSDYQESDIFRVQNSDGDNLFSVGSSGATIAGVVGVADGIDSSTKGGSINIGVDSGNADQINLNKTTLVKTQGASGTALAVQGSDGQNILSVGAIDRSVHIDAGQLSIVNSGDTSLFTPTGTTTSNPTGSYTAGLAATWYNGVSSGNAYMTPRSGTLAFSGNDGPIDWPNLNWTRPAGVSAYYINTQWVGWVKADQTGTYTFSTTSDDGSRLYLAGTEIVNSWYSQGAITRGASVELTANTWYPIEIQYFQGSGDASINVKWVVPGSNTNVDIPLPNLSSTAPNGNIFSGSFSSSAMIAIQAATGQTSDIINIQDASASSLMSLSSSGVLNVSNQICVAMATCTAALGVTGDIAATGTVTGGVGSPDYAENIAVADGSIAPADVIAMDGDGSGLAVKATKAYSSLVMGVVSTNPGFITNASSANEVTAANQRPLALSGRVPVKISNINGAITVGDYLTSSDIPGIAMKATGPGPVIGVAMENFTGSEAGNTICTDPSTDSVYECGEILFFINPSATNPGLSYIQGSSAIFNSIAVVGGLTTASLSVSGVTNLSSLTVAGDTSMAGNLTVTGETHLADLYVDGHIVTSGYTPSVSVTATAGTGANVSIAGDDSSGTVTITLGRATADDSQSTDPIAGALAEITFAKPYTKTPQITLTPGSASTADSSWWRSANRDSFTINVTNTPVPGSTYVFDYFVRQ